MSASATKKIEWNQLIETALTVEGSLGNTFNRFYDYSFMNQIMLMWQGVFEPVATYKRWDAMGRHVKKGSAAKEICMPIMRYLTDEEIRQSAKLKKGAKVNIVGSRPSTVVGFKPVKCIFKLSETEGEDLKPVEIPDWNLDLATETLKVKKVDFRQINGNIQGYSQKSTYAINPVAVDPISTTMHELAHIVLGHTKKENNRNYHEDRGVQEFQAEITAFLVMKELEMLNEKKASETRAYIQHWLNGEKPDDKMIRQVFSATNKILKAGRPAKKKAKK